MEWSSEVVGCLGGAVGWSSVEVLGSGLLSWASGVVKWGSKVVKWGSGDVKLGSEVVKWSGLVETQTFKTCVFFFATKIYLILLLKTSSDPSYFFSKVPKYISDLYLDFFPQNLVHSSAKKNTCFEGLSLN